MKSHLVHMLQLNAELWEPRLHEQGLSWQTTSVVQLWKTWILDREAVQKVKWTSHFCFIFAAVLNYACVHLFDSIDSDYVSPVNCWFKSQKPNYLSEQKRGKKTQINNSLCGRSGLDSVWYPYLALRWKRRRFRGVDNNTWSL